MASERSRRRYQHVHQRKRRRTAAMHLGTPRRRTAAIWF